MIKLAVAGSPIGHSLSPLLHSTAYDILGVKADFGSNEIKEQDFGNYYFECKNSGFRGLALTMPLKEISIGFVDRVDPIAKQISSVTQLSLNQLEVSVYQQIFWPLRIYLNRTLARK